MYDLGPGKISVQFIVYDYWPHKYVLAKSHAKTVWGFCRSLKLSSHGIFIPNGCKHFKIFLQLFHGKQAIENFNLDFLSVILFRVKDWQASYGNMYATPSSEILPIQYHGWFTFYARLNKMKEQGPHHKTKCKKNCKGGFILEIFKIKRIYANSK